MFGRGKDTFGKKERGQIMKGLSCQVEESNFFSKTTGNHRILHNRKIVRSYVKMYKSQC